MPILKIALAAALLASAPEATWRLPQTKVELHYPPKIPERPTEAYVVLEFNVPGKGIHQIMVPRGIARKHGLSGGERISPGEAARLDGERQDFESRH